MLIQCTRYGRLAIRAAIEKRANTPSPVPCTRCYSSDVAWGMCLQNNQMYSSPTLDLTCPEITISKQTRFWDCNRVIKWDYTWALVDMKFLFELNTRTKIPYQQATMYYCVYHINTTALCWQWKVNFINEWKQKDRQSPNEIVKCVDAKAQHEKMRWNTTKSNHRHNFQCTKLPVIDLVLTNGRSLSDTRPKSDCGKSSSCPLPKPSNT